MVHGRVVGHAEGGEQPHRAHAAPLHPGQAFDIETRCRAFHAVHAQGETQFRAHSLVQRRQHAAVEIHHAVGNVEQRSRRQPIDPPGPRRDEARAGDKGQGRGTDGLVPGSLDL